MFYPVALATLVAEVLGWRSVYYYMCSWGGIVYARLSSAERWPPPSETYYAQYSDYVLAGSAALGGLAYWAIAGRLVIRRRKKLKHGPQTKQLIESEHWLYRRP